MELQQLSAGEGFVYADIPQRSPEWVNARIGRVTASSLYRWLATSKTNGKPLKARLDYEKELAFEKQFNTPFSHFVTGAMEAGIQAEQYVRDQYSSIMGIPVQEAGIFYNEQFGASPDGLVGDDGLVEVKWLQDSAFTDVLANGVPENYYLQIQGQLMASGRKWCDFIAGNGNTNKMKIIRVKRDPETIKRIKDSLADLDKIEYKFDTDGVFGFIGNDVEFQPAEPEGDPWL